MSQRNDMVTRWKKDTWYDVEIFDMTTREIIKEQRVIKGYWTDAIIRKKLAKKLPADKVIVSVKITAYKKRLYAMPEEQYFAAARVIAEEAPEAGTK